VDGPRVSRPAGVADARAAGLRYVNDAEPGIRRVRHGRGFAYLDAEDAAVRDRRTLDRIRALAIPPAWTDVWICRDERGHLQATGRDARGRKQYRYHPEFRARRDLDKYARTERFARALPRIRERVEQDLGERGLPRERVLAAAVRLLERTLIRVGNDEYARENRSFGVATLQDRHARIDGSEVRLHFRGKSGRSHEVSFRDPRLAAIVKRCRDLPGQDLFQWVDDDGELHDVRSDDINAYIREAAGSDEFSAKDFRTWAGTVLAFRALAATGQGLDPAAAEEPSARALQRAVKQAAETAAERLGNTPTVARQAYVHPAVIDAYLDGGVRDAILSAADVSPALPLPPTPEEEQAVLALLADQARGERDRASRVRAKGGSRTTGRRRAQPRASRDRARPARVSSPSGRRPGARSAGPPR
jgi:DNA topoisomerase I